MHFKDDFVDSPFKNKFNLPLVKLYNYETLKYQKHNIELRSPTHSMQICKNMVIRNKNKISEGDQVMPIHSVLLQRCMAVNQGIKEYG